MDALLLEAYVPMINITGVDFTVIMQEITALIPALLPAVFGVLAVRKGLSFIMGMVRGA